MNSNIKYSDSLRKMKIIELEEYEKKVEQNDIIKDIFKRKWKKGETNEGKESVKRNNRIKKCSKRRKKE